MIGLDHLDLVEDVVQDAFIQALRKWPSAGIPENPGAWILQVAKNRAIDLLRRQGRWREKQDELERLILPGSGPPDPPGARVYFSDRIADDELRMVFAACHPALSRDAQVALTLKAVCGFGVDEIARAFLKSKPTIAQRLVRAKRTLRERSVTLEMPSVGELPAHLDSVLEVFYLLFNEGYSASVGDDLVRAELCVEAIRLTELVAAHPAAGGPRVHALAALFLFQTARLPARADMNGELIPLERQDRAVWDRVVIRRALEHQRRSARGSRVTSYHLQAEIASCHTLAASWADTDWPRILECYDSLLAVDPSPVVALNRVVALAEVRGAETALAELVEVADDPLLASYYHRFAIEGDLLSRLGRGEEAREALARATSLAGSRPVQQYLKRRAREGGVHGKR